MQHNYKGMALLVTLASMLAGTALFKHMHWCLDLPMGRVYHPCHSFIHITGTHANDGSRLQPSKVY